jgi:adenosine deaminase
MWGIAHAQGIKLPTKDYWEFRDMITVSKRSQSFDGYLQLFHWTELIQSSPIAVERAVYEVVGGAYRKNNVTTMELRFNPMKRNRGGEQDLDHIIAAAVRGMDQGDARVPDQARLIFCLDRAFPSSSTRSSRRRRSAGATEAWSASTSPVPESSTFRGGLTFRRLFRRRAPVRARADRSTPARPARSTRSPGSSSCLEPDRHRATGVKAGLRPAGHGDDPRAGHRPRDLPDIEPEHAASCRVGTSSAGSSTRFRRNEVRFTINTDGPEMLKTYIRDEMAHRSAGSGSCRSRTRSRPQPRHSRRRSSRTCRTCPRLVCSPPRAWWVEREEA